MPCFRLDENYPKGHTSPATVLPEITLDYLLQKRPEWSFLGCGGKAVGPNGETRCLAMCAACCGESNLGSHEDTCIRKYAGVFSFMYSFCSWPRTFETPRRRDEGGVLMFHQYRLAAALPPWGCRQAESFFTVALPCSLPPRLAFAHGRQ